MTQSLREMAFADADLTDDEDGGVLSEVAVRGQIMTERVV